MTKGHPVLTRGIDIDPAFDENGSTGKEHGELLFAGFEQGADALSNQRFFLIRHELSRKINVKSIRHHGLIILIAISGESIFFHHDQAG